MKKRQKAGRTNVARSGNGVEKDGNGVAKPGNGVARVSKKLNRCKKNKDFHAETQSRKGSQRKCLCGFFAALRLCVRFCFLGFQLMRGDSRRDGIGFNYSS
jgi:hypothetical protein